MPSKETAATPKSTRMAGSFHFGESGANDPLDDARRGVVLGVGRDEAVTGAPWQRPAALALRIARTTDHSACGTDATGICSWAATWCMLTGSPGPMPERRTASSRWRGETVFRQSRTS